MARKKEAVGKWVKVGSRHYPSSAGTFGKVPFIRLSGKWISKAGFIEGQLIQVHVSEGKIVLTSDQGPNVAPGTESQACFW